MESPTRNVFFILMHMDMGIYKTILVTFIFEKTCSYSFLREITFTD